VEAEAIGDTVTDRIQRKKYDFRKSVNGSLRTVKEPAHHGDRPTNSVAQLLELVYIKNVKLKVKEERTVPKSLHPIAHTNSASLVSSHHRLKKEDFQAIHYTYPEWRSSSSIVESRMIRLTKPGVHAAALAVYANQHIIRCYPAGSRVESTNYDPSPAWNAGIQIVALNYQTNSKSVWLNQGKFADNGACGYVLKPAAMLNARLCGTHTPEEEDESQESKQYWDLLPKVDEDPRGDRLTITIISAHYLPKPLGVNEEKAEVIDPMINVYICGYEHDQGSFKTKVVEDNGFNPEFNEAFTISLHRPELDLILFEVMDKGNFGESFVAQNCFPLNLVRPGYRCVPLRRADSTPIPDAFLFVHVKWERGVVAW